MSLFIHLLQLDFRTPPGFDRTRNAEIGNKDIKLKHLEEAFTSEHWLVRIYKVKNLENRDRLEHKLRSTDTMKQKYTSKKVSEVTASSPRRLTEADGCRCCCFPRLCVFKGNVFLFVFVAFFMLLSHLQQTKELVTLPGSVHTHSHSIDCRPHSQQLFVVYFYTLFKFIKNKTLSESRCLKPEL